jgi:organic hydroperoxide reductase OsmC/OhrA
MKGRAPLALTRLEEHAMPPTHHYRCSVEWTVAGAGPARTTKTFSRDARVSWPGRPAIEASSAPEYQGNPDRVNPEELFVASLALCQMYSYLYAAAQRGVAVTRYSDDAEGELAFRDGAMRITQVTLRPAIILAADADLTLAAELVERAHQGCFIANSVACAVVIEATFQVATAEASHE